MEHPGMPAKGSLLKEGTKETIQVKNKDLIHFKAYIDGQWVDAKDGTTFEVFNKATGASLGHFPDMSAKDTEAAIDAAEAALPAWSGLTPKRRSELLFDLFHELQANAEDLAKIIVAENGKSLTEAKGELGYSNSFIEWFAGEAPRVYGHTVPGTLPAVKLNVITKKPIGVAALLTPWNFPAAMITRKLGPALAAGCTTVIKSPAETPFSGAALVHLCEKVGIPKGVVNWLTCAKGKTEAAVGLTICESPKVKKISFTGSTPVGKLLMKQSSSTLKKLSFELGGNAPFIVFDDADLDKAVEGALACKFRASGQTCVCANRIYVQNGIYDRFVDAFAEKVKKFKVGYGMEEGVTHGPLVSKAGLEKVEKHVEDTVKAGGKIVLGGKRGEGLFFQPTIIRDVPAHCPMAEEETFGPVAAVIRFETEEEAVKAANDVSVGLAGYFYSQDVSRCWRVAEALQVGMVGCNTGLISQPVVPFGGVGESGFGREGGRAGIEEYLTDHLIVFG